MRILKGILVTLAILVVAFVFVVVTSEKPPTDAERKEAYQSWHGQMTTLAAQYDLANANWQAVWQALSDGKISRSEAYTQIKGLGSAYRLIGNKLSDIKPPAQLLKKHQDELTAAIRDFKDAAMFWTIATDEALKWLDDAKLSTQDSILYNAERASAAIAKMSQKVRSVEVSLGIVR